MADIPINEVTRRVQFTGNTTVGPFAFTFNILDDDDLVVYKNFVLQTITTDYTVSTNANGTGSITMTTALVASDVLTIIGGRALERTTDFVTAGDLLASSLNEQLDSLVIMAQQLDEKLDRSVKVDIGDQFTDLSLPAKADRLGTVLAFNATSGDPEAGPEIGDVSTIAAITADIATLADIEDGTDATDAIQTVAGISSNVTTVASISSDVTTVAGITSNIASVVADEADIGTVAGSIANVNLTGGSISSVNTVAGSISNVNTTATNIADVNTVAGVSTDVSTVAGISSNVSTVSGISANVTTVAGISSNVTTVAGISGNVTTVAGQTTNLQNVTDNLTAIQNAATNATNAATSASNAATSATAAAASQTAAAASAASAASSYDSFDDRYLGVKASDPTLDNDGDPLSSGLLYFSSSENIMKVYDGASWIAATSAGNVSLTTYQYTATGGQTTFSGSDDNAATLTYTVNNILVTLNGSLLFNGTDYTATNGTSIVLSSGATASDVLQVTAFASFTTADMVPASTGGTFSGNVAVTGDLTVDTNTLYVDSTNNNVGIGTSSPNSYASQTTLTINGSTYGRLDIESAGTLRASLFSTTGSTTLSAATDVLSFDTSGGEAMRIDSSGRVFVGFDNAAYANGDLVVGKGTASGNSTLGIQSSGSANLNKINFGDGGRGDRASIISGATNYLAFSTFDGSSTTTERMRIDSSGNVLVGSTDTTPYDNTSGNAIRIGDGLITSAQEGGNAAIFNRMLSDGSIVQFRKDGSTVGSIGSYSGVGMYAMAPNNGGSGLLFYDNAAPIYPIKNVSGSATIGDAYTDLGAAVHRFKDLYLSGGVYLGGTGSANKLDDYEEGTWTPLVAFGGSNVGQSYQIQNGYYTKVGRLVTFTLRVQFTNKGTSTGSVGIYGLPFTTQNAFASNTGAYFGFVDNAGANWGSNNLIPTIDPNSTVINLRYVNSSGSYQSFTDTDFSNTTDIIMGGQIFTS